ncbi:glycosyltransferase family 1 protein [Phormidium sp. FACHB-592]|uniref:Glycosyltransferase subfamily 4-like N-terminal domain-containing protein n=2 Tax=Stenomitos TaxID=1844270 RepID=A0ABV0KKK7_9CYAN|nr:glycosyltransferase family 1 protein [Phormidium sp. FACHB-592]MBD2075253.1 glycosyltransferase family 1 protein [Phormidium sp. FACHB-592]
MPMDILQIYPRLPPTIDGIGDYAMTLAKGLSQCNIRTYFMTAHQEKMFGDERFPIVPLHTHSPQAFVDAIPQHIQAVILHFSDYPYDAKRGIPVWLVRALETMKQQRSLRLLVMFHEFPSFYLLKKTFYLFPWQRSVAWQLAQLADVIITNNAVTKTLIAKYFLAKDKQPPILNLPVFSNIGELEKLLPLEQRQRRLIVFGTPGRRARIYQRSQAMLKNCCQLLGIEEICDIGSPLHLDQSTLAGIPLVEMGEQPAARISQLMSDSLAGIVYSTDNGRLAKSGVFATYCAHGLVPIVTQEKATLLDGLQAETNFLFAGMQAESLAMERLQAIADAAHQWYVTHNQASTFKSFLLQLSALSKP